MGKCEEEGLFKRELLKVTNFGLLDSLRALISNLPELEPVSLNMRVPRWSNFVRSRLNQGLNLFLITISLWGRVC